MTARAPPWLAPQPLTQWDPARLVDMEQRLDTVHIGDGGEEIVVTDAKVGSKNRPLDAAQVQSSTIARPARRTTAHRMRT